MIKYFSTAHHPSQPFVERLKPCSFTLILPFKSTLFIHEIQDNKNGINIWKEGRTEYGRKEIQQRNRWWPKVCDIIILMDCQCLSCVIGLFYVPQREDHVKCLPRKFGKNSSMLCFWIHIEFFWSWLSIFRSIAIRLLLFLYLIFICVSIMCVLTA